jgi:hypothetical protein
MEAAGEKAGQVGEDMKAGAQAAGERIKDATGGALKSAGEGMERTGEKMQGN